MDALEREVFHAFSVCDTDGDGFITFQEMRAYIQQQLQAQAPDRPETEVEQEANNLVLQCFREVDINHDGILSFEEFKKWYFSNQRQVISGDRQRISIPGATYCYLQSITQDGKRKYVSAGTLDPHARKCYKEVFVAYIIEAVLDDNRLFRTLRRYSNLRQFVHTLKTQLHINIPVAFPRRTLGEVDVEVRRQALETYFRFLFKDPAVRRSSIVLNFLSGSDAIELQLERTADMVSRQKEPPVSPIQDRPAAPERPLLDTAHLETESSFGVEFNDDMSVVMSDDSAAPEERLKQLGIKLPTPVEQYWAKDGAFITVRLPVDSTPIQAADAMWAKEREVAVSMLAQLSWAADGCLSALTTISLAGSAPEHYFQAVKTLLRNLFGERGRLLACGQDMLEMQRRFSALDLNGDGFITSQELEVGLRRLGWDLDRNTINLMVQMADTNGDGKLDYQEFLSVVYTGKAQDDEMRRAFKKFDRDGSGKISASELKKTLAELGQNISLQDAREIIFQNDRNGDGQLDYLEFITLMRELRGSGQDDSYLVLTAHITVDSELLRYQSFIQRLRNGVSLVKHGRKGNGVRKFFLEQNRRRLSWRKAGLKAAAKGYFDLTKVTHITVNPSDPRIFTLVAPDDCLILEASSADERGDLVEGFTKLLLRSNEAADSSEPRSTSSKNKKTRDQKVAELLAVFEDMDAEKTGYLSAVELGRAMTRLDVRVHQSDVERILASVDSCNGEYDYRAFAWELAGADDSELQGKLSRQTQLIELMERFDTYHDGTLTAFQLGQAIANEDIPQDLLRIAQHEAQHPQTHRIYYRQFARIVCGLDDQINAFIMQERVKRQTQRLNELRSDRLRHYKDRLLNCFGRFDPRNEGLISLLDLGQALGSLNANISADKMAAITAKAQTSRDRRVSYNPTVVDALADLLVSQEQDAWQQVFRRWDNNKDGLISTRELHQALSQLGHSVSVAELEARSRKHDSNRDGLLNYSEFVDLLLESGEKPAARA